jgi:hypothetical protein
MKKGGNKKRNLSKMGLKNNDIKALILLSFRQISFSSST